MKAPELKFIVVHIPKNESTFFRNELLTIPWVSSIETDIVRKPASLYSIAPDDPDLEDLWAFNRTRIYEAWDILSMKSDSANISVAVIDTGIDCGHEDLTYAISPDGFDWVLNRSEIIDTDGHGTFLAGVVGGESNNGKGIAGVARTVLIPERVGTNESGFYSSLSAAAIQHAADMGARIILIGYGGPGQSPAEEAAIEYAAKKGCILIAPAGNGASNEGHYPSDYSDVISVGSIAKTDGLSYFSNYGIFVDLVAPGEGIISTWVNNSYFTATGTSAAAAMVAGAAVLVLEMDPQLDRIEVREILTSTAGDLGRTGKDIYYGYGLLDVGSAVSKVQDNARKQKRSQHSALNISVCAECADGNLSNSSSLDGVIRKEVSSMETAQLSLSKGWNFISLPSVPGSKKTSGDIFQGINTDGHTIWKYNSLGQDWISVERDTNFTPLEGFLVYSDRKTTVPLVLDTRDAGNEISLRPGWNLVGSPYQVAVNASEGLSSLSEDWVSLLMYNSSTQMYDPAIIKGASGLHSDSRTLPAFSAFWVYMNKESAYKTAE
jgi:hypothetical protein